MDKENIEINFKDELNKDDFAIGKINIDLIRTGDVPGSVFGKQVLRLAKNQNKLTDEVRKLREDVEHLQVNQIELSKLVDSLRSGVYNGEQDY